jgi:hypothetical protein
MSAVLQDPDGNSFTLLSYKEMILEIESERRTHTERIDSENRAAREREFARAVQARLLPQAPPSLNTLECAADGNYATLFFAEYDDSAKLLRYANCGHLPGLVLTHDGKLERLEPTCTVLGLFREWNCSVGELSLFPGDTVALYTDGVTEARNDADEEFGEERLIATLRQNRQGSSQASLAAVLNSLRCFNQSREQHDDITLVFARCKEN